MALPSLSQALSTAGRALEANAAELNRLDGHAGDGDLGITMSEVAKVLREVGAGQLGPGELLSACGSLIARRAPSTSGTLTATAFLRASRALPSAGAGLEALVACFEAAMEGVRVRGKASVGDRTVLDALDAVCKSLRAAKDERAGVGEALQRAASAAARATDETASMVPKAGRARWVAERALGHPDAGCAALAIALGAVAEEARA
jgi:dihydroxyacetone kinase-like protein